MLKELKIRQERGKSGKGRKWKREGKKVNKGNR